MVALKIGTYIRIKVPYCASYSNKVNNDSWKDVSVRLKRACAGLWAGSSGAGRMEQYKERSGDFFQTPSHASLLCSRRCSVPFPHSGGTRLWRGEHVIILSPSFQPTDMSDGCKLSGCGRLQFLIGVIARCLNLTPKETWSNRSMSILLVITQWLNSPF